MLAHLTNDGDKQEGGKGDMKKRQKATQAQPPS